MRGGMPLRAPPRRVLIALWLFVCALGMNACRHPRAPRVAASETRDLQTVLDGLLADGRRTVTVPPGDYRVTPRDKVHLRIQNLDNVTLRMDGVRMICAETTRALELRDCTNLVIRGLTIDYDPLPFTQFVITRIAEDTRSFEMELAEGYDVRQGTDDPAGLRHVMIMDPATALIRVIYGASERIEHVAGRRYRYTKVPAYRRDSARPLERVGDVVVVSNHYAPGGAAPLAVLIGNCVRLTVEDVRIWSAGHIAVFEGGCEDVVYRRVTIDRCPPESDYRPRAVPRYRSANRDGFHLLGNRGRTVLEDCAARFMDDDGVNVHGAAQLITACEGARLRILDKHGERVVHPGDRVELIGFDGRRLGPANIVAIEKTDPPTPAEKTFCEKHISPMLAPSRAWVVTLDREPGAGMGSLIYPANRAGNQCVIRNSRFGYGRSRGIVLRGSQARIENCVIEGNWQKGVMITGEFFSLEGGFSTNVVVTGNRIASLRNEAVDVAYVTPEGSPAPVGLFRDITITRNRLEGATAGGRLIGVEGVVIHGNTFATAAPAVLTQNCARIVSDVACTPLDGAAATPPAR